MKIAENLFIRMYPEMKEMTSDGKVPIYVKVTVAGSKPKEFSTGEKAIPECWDNKSWRVKGKSPDILNTNNRLTQLKAKLEKLYLLLTLEYDVITSQLLIEAYKGVGRFAPSEKKPNRTLMQAFNYKYSLFAHQVRKGLRADTTLRKWKTTKRKLRDYLHSKYQKWDMPLSAFEYDDAVDLMNYLTLAEDLEECTARKYVKNTKKLFDIAETKK